MPSTWHLGGRLTSATKGWAQTVPKLISQEQWSCIRTGTVGWGLAGHAGVGFVWVAQAEEEAVAQGRLFLWQWQKLKGTEENSQALLGL